MCTEVFAGGGRLPTPTPPTNPRPPTDPQPPSEPPHVFRSPKSDAAVFYVKNNFTLRTESNLKTAVSRLKGSKYSYNKSKDVYTWDLNGGILDGKNQSGDGGQDEDQEPLIRVRIPLVIKNGFIRNNKDAVYFYVPDSGVERITWLNVGEDAVGTSKGAYNFRAIDCEAINSRRTADKSFQFNEAKGLVVEDNVIKGGITGMRIGDSKINSVSDRAYVRNNKFIDVDTAHNLSSITVEETGPSKYINVRLRWKHSNGSKLIEYHED